jgi:hypothetical protein
MRDEPPTPETPNEFQQRLLRESRALIEKAERLLEETADLVPTPPLPIQSPPDQDGDGQDDLPSNG